MIGRNRELQQKLLGFQCNELTEHHIYARLSGAVRSAEMTGLSLAVATFRFGVGYLLRSLFGIEV